jgi:hypothetical protein
MPVAIKFIRHRQVTEWTFVGKQLMPAEVFFLEQCQDSPVSFSFHSLSPDTVDPSLPRVLSILSTGLAGKPISILASPFEKGIILFAVENAAFSLSWKGPSDSWSFVCLLLIPGK